MPATRGTGGSNGDGSRRSRLSGGPADRAQSITIGALFLFAFLILALAIVQTVFVPQENQQVEFNHNKRVQDDMVALRSNLLRSAATGDPRSSSVELGTSYPTRTLLLNPPPPSGTLRTADRANISLTNAVATGGAGDYFDGGNRTFRTKAIVYQPSYNVYTTAPDTVIGSSVVYERYPGDGGGTVTPGSNQTVINSRTISLVAIRGDYYQSSATATTVDPRVLSATNRTLTVSDDGDPVVLKLPTRLTEERWRDLLSSELDPNANRPDRYVREVACDVPSGEPCGTVEITLERGVEYNLRMGAVGVGGRGEREGVTNEPWYVVSTDGNGSTAAEGRTRRVSFEVRDRFNNPVSGADLSVAQPRTGYVTDGDERVPADGPVNVTTGSNGRATVTYHAPLNARRSLEVSFDARFPGAPVEARERVRVDLTAQDDADQVDDAEWPRPLIEAVEHEPRTDGGGDPVGGSETTEFVRLQVTEPGTYEFTRAGQPGSVTISPDAGDIPADGTLDYYLVDGSLGGPCADEVRFSKSLPFPLDDGDTLLLNDTAPGGGRDPVVRDRLTIQGSPDGNGTGTDFEVDGVGLRRVEDGAHVDTNRTLDWNTTLASNPAVCGQSSGRMDVLFQDNFENRRLTKWVGLADDPDGNGVENGVQGVDDSVVRFNRSAYIGANTSESPPGDDSRIESLVTSDTRAYSELVVSLEAYDDGPEPPGSDVDEALVVEYRSDRTGGWVEIGRVSPRSNDGAYLGAQTFRLERADDPAAFATGFQLRLRQPRADAGGTDTGSPEVTSDDRDRWYVDGVVLSAK